MELLTDRLNRLEVELKNIKKEIDTNSVDKILNKITRLKIAAEEANLKPVNIRISSNIHHILLEDFKWRTEDRMCLVNTALFKIFDLPVRIDHTSYDDITIEVTFNE